MAAAGSLPRPARRRTLDLVAKLPVRAEAGEGVAAGEANEWLALIHVEFESGTGISAFRPRLLWYHVNLRQRHRLPVLPVALYQQIGLDGIGEDEYVEQFGTLEVIRFRYLYIGFPRLEAEDYLHLPNPLAPGVVALMKVAEARQARIKAEAARRIATDNTNPQQKHLLLSCLERYLSLSEVQELEYDRLMQQTEFLEVRSMAITTFEKGIEKGKELAAATYEKEIEKGREDVLRRTVLLLLEQRFGALAASVRHSVATKSADELEDIVRRILTATSLKDLGFE